MIEHDQLQLCKNHNAQIEKLFTKHDELSKDLAEQKLLITKMAGDVAHTSGRIDNGLSVTITTLSRDFRDFMGIFHSDVMPKVRDNSWWVDVIKKAFVWVTTIGVLGGFVGVIFVAIRKAMGG